MCHMLHPSQSSWFDHPNNILYSVQMMKLLNVQSSPVPCYLITSSLLGPNIFLSTLFSSDTFSPHSSLNMRHHVSLPHKLNWLNTWLAVNRRCRAKCNRIALVNKVSKARGLKIWCCHSCWCQQVVPRGGWGMWWCSCHMVGWQWVMMPWCWCHRAAGKTTLQSLRISH